MCTGLRFTDHEGAMYFGRNLDWSEGYGERIVVTGRQYDFAAAFLGHLPVKYAAIGMGIVEAGMPLYFDCGNEAGLAIAGLNFPGYASYEPFAVDGKTNIAAYEFPLLVATQFSNVDDVEEMLKNVAIVAKPINERYPVSMLHWLIGDAKRSIVVEYTEHGMEIYHNDVDVLTNQPGFAWHRENLRNYMNLQSEAPEHVTWRNATLKPFGAGSLMRGIPGDYYATSRFVRVAYLNTHYPVKESEAENVSRLFHTLTGVAMIDGASQMSNGMYEKTIYTGGYSQKTKSYYYNTYEDPAIRHTSLNDYDVANTALLTPDV